MRNCKLEACAKCRAIHTPTHPTPAVVSGRFQVRLPCLGSRASLVEGLAGRASVLGKASAPSSGCTEASPAGSGEPEV